MQFLNTRVPSGRVLGVIIANPQRNAVFTLSWALDSSILVHFCNSNLYEETPRYSLGVFPPFLTAKYIFLGGPGCDLFTVAFISQGTKKEF